MAEIFNMENEFIYKGYFYLPENSDNTVFGSLSFVQSSGALLELAGSLTGVMNRGVFKPEIILGETSDGKKLTLYKCLENNRHLSSPGYISTKFSAIYLFVGAHFPDSSNIKFSEAYFEFHNLDQWLDISGFKINDSKHQSDKELKIYYELPERLYYKLDTNTDFGFSFSHSSFQINTFQKNIQLEQHSNIFFHFKSNCADLNTILDLLNAFQNYLALATYGVTYAFSIILINPDNYFQYDDNIHHEEIKLFIKRNRIFDDSRTKDKFQMLFNFQQVKYDFQKMFLKWLKIRNDLEPAINLLFDYFYKSRTFTTNHFLNIIHAIETYHRRCFNNFVINPETHKKRLDTIYKNVSEEHLRWLKEKLLFSHEPSLKERLEEIIDSVENDVLLKVIGSKDEFIKAAKNSRNYYVHFSPSLKKKALVGGQLYHLSEKLKYLLIYCLLKDIGISENDISKVFSKNRYELFGHLDN
ncbi:MAG: HEPN domain-containing protein [Bacteroidota bacterium]